MRRRPLRGCPVLAARCDGPQHSTRFRMARASAGPRSPNVCLFAPMHVLGHTAGKRDNVGRALVGERIEPEQRLRSLGQQWRRRGLEQPVRHSLDDPRHAFDRRASRQPRARRRLRPRSGVPHPRCGSRGRSHRRRRCARRFDRGRLDDAATLAHCELRRSTADVEVEYA